MIETGVAMGYAQALFEIAIENGDGDEVEKDMESIKELLETNRKFRDVLYHPAIVKSEKKSLIDKTIGPQCSKWVRNLLFVLIDKRRERILETLVDLFRVVAARIKGVDHVQVQTAFRLTGPRLEKLKESLEKLTGKKIKLETEVNKDIVGGMIIRIGNRIIDGSVTNHLKNLKQNLLKVALT